MNQELCEFCRMLSGTFDNSAQIRELSRTGAMPAGFPLAKHINTVCNDHIENLPEDFEGYFMLEESYYVLEDRTNVLPHLFLFTVGAEGIVLDSYEIPEGYTKETFCIEKLGQLDYSQLKRSKAFTPITYKKSGDTYTGHSVSMFSPVLRFTLTEQVSPEVLSVSEIFEVNGRRTFGYDIPIEYRPIPPADCRSRQTGEPQEP